MSETSSSIGVITPVMLNPFVEKLMHALQEVCEAEGCTAVAAASFSDPQKEAELIAHFRDMGTDGIVIVSPCQPREVLYDQSQGGPMLLVSPEPPVGKADTMQLNEDRAAQIVADHLVSRGWKKMVYVPRTLEVDSNWRTVKQEALERAARDRRLQFRIAAITDSAEHLVHCDAAMWKDTQTGLVTHTGMTGVEMAQLLRSAGFELGTDIGLVVYDDAFVAADSGLDVTTVDIDMRAAASLMLDTLRARRRGLIEGPGREILSEPILMARDSS